MCCPIYKVAVLKSVPSLIMVIIIFHYLNLSSVDTIISLMLKIRTLKCRKMKQFIWEHTVNEWKVVGIGTYSSLLLCPNYLSGEKTCAILLILRNFYYHSPKTPTYFFQFYSPLVPFHGSYISADLAQRTTAFWFYNMSTAFLTHVFVFIIFMPRIYSLRYSL